MVKILFVDNLADTFLSHRLALAEAVRQSGVVVEVALPPGPMVAQVTGLAFTVHRLDLDRRGMNPVREVLTLWRLVRLFRTVRPDLVHLRTPKMWTYGGIAARISGVPAVVSHVTGMGFAHSKTGLASRCAGIIVSLLARHAFGHANQRIIVQNRDDERIVTDKLGVDAQRVRYIPGSGVDVTVWCQQPFPQGVPMVMLPARLLRDKGVCEFVEAANILHKKGVSVRCVLVGDPDLGNPNSIDALQITTWHAEGVVECWGYRRDMREVLAQATIVCLPSYREGLPKVLLEAMAIGRPVIAADTPGTREPVEPGVTGDLVPARNATALADAIASLLADPARCQRYGMAGRELVERRFCDSVVVKSTMRVFRELVAFP